MPRVTADDVREIADLSADLVLTPFILVATTLVDTKLATHAAYTALADSTTILKEVERWLAAHFAKIREKETAGEGVKDVREDYQYKLGDGLRTTMYGQNAVAMDISGVLAKLGTLAGARRASIAAVNYDNGGES